MNIGALKKIILKTPKTSGVYCFQDNQKHNLYIGKAAHLKQRLSSYLKTKDIRIKKMIADAQTIKFRIVGSDIEALILESRLIKKLRPKYNIALRDDKQYFFVGFTKEQFPHIFIGHQPKTYNTNRISSFVGPFTDGAAIKTSLRFLRNIFPYCICKQKHNLPCLNYHIGNCPGVCCLKTADGQSPPANGKTKEYKRNIKAIKDILNGKRTSLIKNLETEMKKLAKEEKLEQAIESRKKLEKLKRVFENARIIANRQSLIANSKNKNDLKQLAKIFKLSKEPLRIEGYDISNIQGTNAVGSMIVFTDGQPNKNEYRKFKINTKNTPDDTAMLSEMIQRRFKHSDWHFPDLILVDGGKSQLNAIIETNAKRRIAIPVLALTKNEKHLGHKIIMAEKEIFLSKIPPQVKNLLLQIDAEAHRFALNYYRKLHRKSSFDK